LLQEENIFLFGNRGNELIGLSEPSQGDNGSFFQLVDSVNPHLGEFVLFWCVEHAVHHAAHANVHGCLTGFYE
jgi:hypothetical protein